MYLEGNFMKYLIFVLALLFCEQTYGEKIKQTIMKAAVAEEFRHGLHSKYLQYLADKLNLTLQLSTMPFARRLLQIKNGQLDLIVGIQKTEDRQDEFIYILPHYELLSHRIFILKNKRDLIQTYQDLSGKIIGVNRNSKYYKAFDNNESVVKFKAHGVLQNIELLKRNRIDAFMHYEESTVPLLDGLGISDEVVKSVYQPNIEIQHYIAISKSSALNSRLGELEQIVEDAVKNKDFLNIRMNHYAEMNITSIVQ